MKLRQQALKHCLQIVRASPSIRRSAPSREAKPLFSTTATSFSAAVGFADASSATKKPHFKIYLDLQKQKGQTFLSALFKTPAAFFSSDK